jgi:glycine dehydrogenase
MGADGLRARHRARDRGANYVAARLRDAFPVLYTGAGGHVAHECILDLRPITKRHGGHRRRRREAPDGFRLPCADDELPGGRHPDGRANRERGPREIDRFCDAMLADPVARSTPWRAARSPSTTRRCGTPRTRPRTCSTVGTGRTRRRSGRTPTFDLRAHKYFPPVSRIDGAYGDRHLVCSCEPLEAYAEAGVTAVG